MNKFLSSTLPIYILGWFLSLTIKDILYFCLAIVVYILIKQPVNYFIYDYIQSKILAFLIALFISYIISKISRILFSYYLKNLDYNKYLDNYLFDSVIN